MSHAIPPIRLSQQAYLRPTASKAAIGTAKTTAAEASNGRQQSQPSPEDQTWLAASGRSKNRSAGAFAEIIQEEERKI
jgi:hypothetical protein